jgi:hypothetical protein
MSKKLWRSNDWLSYNPHFKDLGFLIVSTILIGVFVIGSNPKPLKSYFEANQHSRAPIGLRSKIFPLAFMGSFGIK